MDKNIKAIIILLFTTLFWGGNFVVGKIVVNSIPPFMMSFSRWLIALFILVPLLYRKGWPRIEQLKTHWRGLVILAITGVVGFNTLVYFAVKYTSPTNAALVNALTPIVIFILSSVLLSEKLTIRQIIGVMFSFMGVLIVVSQGNLNTLLKLQLNIGDMIMLIAVVFWGIYSIIMKKITTELSSLATITLSAIIGWLLLIPFAIWELLTTDNIIFNASSILGLLYIGVFASFLAFLGWNEGVIRLGPGKAAVFLNLIPFFAAILSYVFLKENISVYQLLGGLIIILGVIYTNLKQFKSIN